eukprot:g8394.t1
MPAAVDSARAADSDVEVVKKINQYIRQAWKDNEIESSPRASDGEFARRASLDIVGHIPTYEQLMTFLEDESPDKRARFVDMLLADSDYIRNWTNIWANILVGRANNRRGNRQALERWLRGEIYRNTPYDKFVHGLVAAEGSVTDNGAVAFLANHLNEQAVPATSITARVFLGLQVQCTQCHNHPFNKWKQGQFWGMNAFFRGTRRQRVGENRNEFRLTDNPGPDIVGFDERSGLVKNTYRKFVDGTIATKVKYADVKPRELLAKFITDPKQPYMARAQVNRVWGHMFGYGFTKPVDDMGPHNPPSHPELLNYLADQFRQAAYDNKRLIRWIAASEAYNLTSRAGEKNSIDNPPAGETPLFSKMYVKQFTAEQLYDSLLIATAADKSNRTSAAAERQRATWLRQFVQTFGTDENDEATTFNGTIPQALVLMNGGLIQSAINGGNGSFLRRVLDAPNGDIRVKPKRTTRRTSRRPTPLQLKRIAAREAKAVPKRIETLFLVALSRKPTTAELEALNEAYQRGEYTSAVEGLQDVFWAILNSNEFIVNRMVANDIDQGHLDILEDRTAVELRPRLSLVPGAFPDDLSFNAESFSAILLSRVMHFFDGAQVERSVERLYEWLIPGGRAFVVVEASIFLNRPPLRERYESQRAAGARWPGFVDNVKTLLPRRAKFVPDQLHYLDPDVLGRAFREAGFVVESAHHFHRNVDPGDPEAGVRESVGLIARKPADDPALRHAILHPDKVVRNSKRYIGNPKHRWEINGKPYTPVDVATFILKKLISSAQDQIGEIEQAVITVPAQFSDAQRHATVEAGHRAGLKRVDIINEPVAAALCYVLGTEGIWFTEIAEQQRIMVYDLGGGTFDLSMVMYQKEEVSVIASSGDLTLGGIDWNHALEQHVAEMFADEFGADPRGDAAAMQYLSLEAEQTKRSLSVRPRAAMACQHAGHRKTYQVEQSQFEELTRDLVDHTAEITKRMLRDNEMGWAHVDVVLTTGGASRMPMIRNKLKQLSGRTLNTTLSPDLSIAHGATYYAGMLLTNDRFAKSILSKEAGRRLASLKQKSVNARALGIMAKDPRTGQRVPHYFLPANTPLPADATNNYGTVIPDQKRVHLQIVESGTSPEKPPSILGDCIIEGLPPNLPVGSEVAVTISYDSEARVHVSAKDVTSGKRATTEIVRQENVVPQLASDHPDEDLSLLTSSEPAKPQAAAAPKTAAPKPTAATPPVAPKPKPVATAKPKPMPVARQQPAAKPQPVAQQKPVVKPPPRPKAVPPAAAAPPPSSSAQRRKLEESNQPIPLCNECGEPLDARGRCSSCVSAPVAQKKPQTRSGGQQPPRKRQNRPAGNKPPQRPAGARSAKVIPPPIDDAEILELEPAPKPVAQRPKRPAIKKVPPQRPQGQKRPPQQQPRPKPRPKDSGEDEFWQLVDD